MTIIRKPNTLHRAFNQIMFQVTDEVIVLTLHYPNEIGRTVEITGVMIDNILSSDVSGVVKYLFKNLRDEIANGAKSGWLYTDYNLQANYTVLGELYTAVNAAAQPGRLGVLPPVLTTRVPENNTYKIPKYEGYPTGICLAYNIGYDTVSGTVYITGVVLDELTGSPIVNTLVRLIVDGTIALTAVTDVMGKYIIIWNVSMSAYSAISSVELSFTEPNHNVKNYTVTLSEYDIAVESGIPVDAILISKANPLLFNVTFIDTVTGDPVNSQNKTVKLLNADGSQQVVFNQSFTDNTNPVTCTWFVSKNEYDMYASGFTLIGEIPGMTGTGITVSGIPYDDWRINPKVFVVEMNSVTVSASPPALSFTEVGGTATFTVTTVPTGGIITAISTSDSWFSAVPQDNIVTVTAQPMTDITRYGMVTVTVSNTILTIPISQVVSGDPVVTPDHLILAYIYDVNDPNTIMNVEANVDWGATVSGSAFIGKVTPLSGTTGDTQLTVSAGPQTSDIRTGKISFTQDGVPGTILSGTTLLSPPSAGIMFYGRITDTINGNVIPNAVVRFEYVISATTVYVVSVYTDEDGVYYFVWNPDSTSYNNTAFVRIGVSKPGYDDNFVTISDFNLPPYLSLSKSPMRRDIAINAILEETVSGGGIFTLNQSSHTFEVAIFSNTTWVVDYSIDNGNTRTPISPNWISGVPSSGNYNMVFNVNVSALPGNISRNCMIYFTTPSGEWTYTSITQIAETKYDLYIRFTLSGDNVPLPAAGLVEVYSSSFGINPEVLNGGYVVIHIQATEVEWQNRSPLFTFQLIDLSTGSVVGTGEFYISATVSQIVAAGGSGYDIGIVDVI